MSIIKTIIKSDRNLKDEYLSNQGVFMEKKFGLEVGKTYNISLFLPTGIFKTVSRTIKSFDINNIVHYTNGRFSYLTDIVSIVAVDLPNDNLITELTNDVIICKCTEPFLKKGCTCGAITPYESIWLRK